MEATEKRLPPNAGIGRPKGVPNKVTKALKEMILGALDDAGGQEYLVKQAEKHPQAFLALIGKVLPKDVHVDQNLTISDERDRIIAEAADLLGLTDRPAPVRPRADQKGLLN